ncbi:MAG: hypothetical protein QG628_65 [Patescibacteria group bacterium]|jgi:hypothetical protein|nr:hypothetical protein [Patescibacteria group bacterium]
MTVRDTGFESWHEGMGLAPFAVEGDERKAPREHKWLNKLRDGMRRGHVNSQVIRAQLIVETLLPKEIGRENQISLRHGGQLTVADLSDSDGRFMMVQFDPENTNGIAFSAYFEDNERFFSAPGCHIRMGEADSEGSFEFNSSTPQM